MPVWAGFGYLVEKTNSQFNIHHTHSTDAYVHTHHTCTYKHKHRRINCPLLEIADATVFAETDARY